MRDLIDILQTISEASNLSPNEFKGRAQRWATFIEKIKTKSPFITVSGKKVVIDPSEAERFMALYANNEFFARTGDPTRATAKLIPGSATPDIKLSNLAKTTEFGGAAQSGKKGESAGKESILVKPSQIGIVDHNIPAAELYETIKSNPILNSTEYGKIVISLADYIVSDEVVMLPDNLLEKDKAAIKAAIVDYAGEYLGVLALLYGRSRFPAKAKFLEWLGGSTDDLVLNFPSKINNPLADSFATITNPNTNHTLNISSKGGAGGAPPAVSGLKIPDYVRSNPKFETVVKFIEICQNVPTLQQGFAAMDLLYKKKPATISKKWHKFLPFKVASPTLLNTAIESWRNSRNNIDTPLPKKYHALFDNIKGKGSDGGKLLYAVKKEVISAINSGVALPEFTAVVLEILSMNFVQQYTDEKNGELTFATQWPAKLDGKISVRDKSGSTDPNKGGFNFKLSPTKDNDESVDDVDGTEPDNMPIVGNKAEQEFSKGAAAAADPSLGSGPKTDSGSRKRRAFTKKETGPRVKRS